MKMILIDGKMYSNIEEIHNLLAREFNWRRYGKNLDALWDFLTTDVERPFEIKWTNVEESKKKIGHDCSSMINLLREVEEWDKLHFAETERFTFIVEY
ncbi:MAG: barstar family protein [Chitinophagales bacterium]|nr:barstar family protein [Chitinophagales bacterium]